MADVEFDDFEGGYRASGSGRMGRLVNIAGAVCSIGLVVGLGFWGYKLAVRDVSGIPVVRALAGPLRIAPENPGGEVALHQGLSVNAVAAAGTAMPLPEKLILAPRDVELVAEDEAGLAVLSELPVVASDALTASAAALPIDAAFDAPIEITAAEAQAELAPLDGAADAVAAANPADLGLADLAAAAPLPATQEDAVAAALAEALAGEAIEAPEAASVGVASVAKSLRPLARPQRKGVEPVALVADVTQVEQVAAVATKEIDPTTIALGARLVQLGAFDDDAGARAEWVKLQGQFPALFGAKAMVIQGAQSGGRTFFRLRAHGFADEDEARSFCAAMLAENASCIPVAQR